MSTRGDIIRGAGGHLQRRGESDVLVGRPHSTLGTNGDIRISMAEGVPRLYAKAGDTWYFTSLSDSDNPTLQLGIPGRSVDIDGNITLTSSDVTVKITGDGLDVEESNLNFANFGSTARIGLVASHNIYLTSTSIALREATTDRITLDSDGDITLAGDVIFASTIGAIKMGSASGGNIMLGHNVGSTGHGLWNISIGFDTGNSINEVTGDALANVMLGASAAKYLTLGSYNVCIGQAAGGTSNSTSIQNADNNVCIGRNSDTKANNDASGIAIGYGAKTGNEALALGKDADAADSCIDIRAAGSTRIYVDANGLVGIGTASPGNWLNV